MGEPTSSNVEVSIHEHIVYGREPGELKHLSTRRKRKKTIDFLSSGERTGKSPNQPIVILVGVTDTQNHQICIVERNWKVGTKKVKSL